MIGLKERAASSSGRRAGIGSGGCTSNAPSDDSAAVLSGLPAAFAGATGTMSSARRCPLPFSEGTMLALSTTTGRITSITTRDLPRPERPAWKERTRPTAMFSSGCGGSWSAVSEMSTITRLGFASEKTRNSTSLGRPIRKRVWVTSPPSEACEADWAAILALAAAVEPVAFTDCLAFSEDEGTFSDRAFAPSAAVAASGKASVKSAQMGCSAKRRISPIVIVV